MTKCIVYWGLLSCAISAFAEEKPEPNHIELVFSNEDKLLGSTSSGSSKEIDWTSPLLAEPAELKLDELMYWQRRTSATPVPDNHTARLEMNKGGVLYGKLQSINSNHDVTLDTDYAGALTVKRSMIRTLTLTKLNETFYQGPTNLKDWKTLNKNAWSLGPKGLQSSQAGTLTRTLPFPKNRFQINMKLSWDSSLDFDLIFLSSNIHSHYPENSYRLNFNRSRIDLSKNWVDENGKGQDFNFLPTARPIAFQNSEEADVSIFVDRESGEISLSVNGEKVGGWIDVSPKQGKMGDGLHLISSDYSLSIQKLSVKSWDGLLEESQSTQTRISDKQTKEGYQLINLRNSDSLIAKVKNVEGDLVNVLTPYGDLAVPLSRMKNIALRPLVDLEYDEAILRDGDVLGHYPNGDTLTFQLLEFTGNRAKVTSQNFGETEIDLSIFPHIDFNLYTEHIMQLRRKQNQ